MRTSIGVIDFHYFVDSVSETLTIMPTSKMQEHNLPDGQRVVKFGMYLEDGYKSESSLPWEKKKKA